jgi:hypothetical protein
MPTLHSITSLDVRAPCWVLNRLLGGQMFDRHPLAVVIAEPLRGCGRLMAPKISLDRAWHELRDRRSG